MSHIRELASHSTIGLQVEVIWTLPRTESLMVTEKTSRLPLRLKEPTIVTLGLVRDVPVQ